MEIILKNPAAERQQVVSALQRFAHDHQIPAAAVHAADLALEEHLTNLLTHSFADKQKHEVKIRFNMGSEFIIEVEDDGPPFNPLELPEVDTTVPLARRAIGGLGIHLMRHFTDALDYTSEGGRNILRMHKKLGAVRK